MLLSGEGSPHRRPLPTMTWKNHPSCLVPRPLPSVLQVQRRQEAALPQRPTAEAKHVASTPGLPRMARACFEWLQGSTLPERWPAGLACWGRLKSHLMREPAAPEAAEHHSKQRQPSPNRLHLPRQRHTTANTVVPFVRPLKLKAVSFHFPAQNRLSDKSLEYCTSKKKRILHLHLSLPCVIQSQQKR